MTDALEGPLHPGRWWHALDDGRVQCDLCPRFCRLHEGQRGACFVRARSGDAMVLTTYGRSSGFCVDPIEKKPLNHFLPGSAVLSFGTAGCNLACKFCFHRRGSPRAMECNASAICTMRVANAPQSEKAARDFRLASRYGRGMRKWRP